MMRRNVVRVVVVAVALVGSAWFGSQPARGQGMDSKDPIMGTWRLDPTRSSLKRGGPEAPARPIRPAMWVFTLEGDGFRMNEYDTDPSSGAPTLSYAAKFDGKEYPHPGGRQKNEIVTHWRLGPDLIVRLAKVNGKPTEWVTWAISSDGKILTTTSWDPDAPQYQNVRVFDREK